MGVNMALSYMCNVILNILTPLPPSVTSPLTPSFPQLVPLYFRVPRLSTQPIPLGLLAEAWTSYHSHTTEENVPLPATTNYLSILLVGEAS